MNEAGCHLTPQCHWDNICAVSARCWGASEADCKALDYCTFDNTKCTQTKDPCVSRSLETCDADALCAPAMACRGTPVPCDTYDDSDACEADRHCDWAHSPAM